MDIILFQKMKENYKSQMYAVGILIVLFYNILILAVLIGIMNYLFVYKISLKDVYENKYIDEKQIKKIALLLTLFNIPYFVYFSIGF